MSTEEATRLVQPPWFVTASTFVLGGAATALVKTLLDNYPSVAGISNLRAELGHTTDRLGRLEGEVRDFRSKGEL